MGRSSDGLRSALFRAVPGGWIFRSPNPWVFGDTPHYLVNDAQKAQIEAIIVPRRPGVVAAALIVGIFAWAIAVAIFMWAFLGHENPTPGDIGVMVVLILLPLMALLPIAGLIQKRRLAPVLAGAPLTSERISYAELRQNVRAFTSPKQSLNALVASVFACFAASFAVLTHLVTRHFLFDAYVAVWGFVAITFGFASFAWYREVLRKASAPEGDHLAGEKQMWTRWIGLGVAGLICVLLLLYLVVGRSDAWGALAVGRAPAGGTVTVSVVGKATEDIARNRALEACRNANITEMTPLDQPVQSLRRFIGRALPLPELSGQLQRMSRQRAKLQPQSAVGTAPGGLRLQPQNPLEMIEHLDCRSVGALKLAFWVRTDDVNA